MTTAIQYINGYELFALCANSSNESIGFNEFEADLSDGYYQQANFGADTGTRTWTLNFQNLSGGSADLDIDRDDVLMNRAEYVWDLFCRSKRTGRPFVIKSPRNDQYYLARFADSRLSFDRVLVKLFSTGLNFKQVRVSGVSVFDTTKLSFWGHWKAQDIEGLSNNDTVTEWLDSSGNGRTFASLTTSVNIHNKYLTNQQNSLPVVSLNVSVSDSWLAIETEGVVIRQALIIMKQREATFSNDAGIISSSEPTDTAVLLGDSGETKFYDLTHSASQDYIYEKNSVEFAETDQQAPMNVFGLVYLSLPEGVPLTDVQIGKDRNFTDRYAKTDIGEVILMENALPDSDIRELIEHLSTIWNIS